MWWYNKNLIILYLMLVKLLLYRAVNAVRMVLQRGQLLQQAVVLNCNFRQLRLRTGWHQLPDLPINNSIFIRVGPDMDFRPDTG